MKKSYQKWLASALACAIMVPFTGCSSDDDLSPIPGGNGEEIKAEFTIAFNKGNGNTKATADEVGNGTFQGMKNIKLLAYGVSQNQQKVLGTDQLSSAIDLADITGETTTSFTKRYKITLKPATVGFMFYGESAYSPAVGKLTAAYPAVSGSANQATFTLNPITEDAATGMTTYLTNVVKAACANTKVESQQALKSFFENATSAGLPQIAYMLAQLYMWEETNFESGGRANVRNAIATQSANPVFTSLTTSEGTIADVYSKRNKEEKYLGKDYPIGGKTLQIKTDFTQGNAGVKVSLESTANTYNYPTSLYYIANSYPVVYADQTASQWSNLSTTFVDLSTMPTAPIALKDQIQYAVGRMDLKLTVPDLGVTGNTSSEQLNNQLIKANELALLGVIVNKQKNVDWQFNAPLDDLSSSSVYDCVINTAGLTHQMLLLPTRENEAVNVILELKNNSNHGFLGLNSRYIPAGAIFYLAAKLDPTKYASSGPGISSVFASDYKTVVNLTLSSLKSATQTIPDLGSSNIDFSLSVDLTWKDGLTFTETIQ